MIYCSLFCLIYFIDSHFIKKLTMFIQVLYYSRKSKNISLGMLMSAKSDTFYNPINTNVALLLLSFYYAFAHSTCVFSQDWKPGRQYVHSLQKDQIWSNL